MKTIVLTGGVACGKSTSADYLAKRFAVPLIDADVLCHELYATPQVCASLRDIFGDAIFDAQGIPDRAAVGTVIFHDSEKRNELNRIFHPRIRETMQNRLIQHRDKGENAVLLVIPLYFETAWTLSVDSVICVWAPRAVQEQRLAERGVPPDQIEPRIKALLPVDDILGKADFALINDGTREDLFQQCDRMEELFV